MCTSEKNILEESRRKNPLKWLPTLYVSEAMPYVAVNVLTVLMYTQLGIGVAEMAFYTSWLYLPWVLKPLWSPIVDLTWTKRKWILAMQALMAVGFVAVAVMLNLSCFFILTLIVFWFLAFFSATHDIAADGFYMLALTEHKQAAYVGVRSTFYRIGTLLGQGGLIAVGAFVAGMYKDSPSAMIYAWSAVFSILGIFFVAVAIYHFSVLPRPRSDHGTDIDGIFKILKDFFVTFVRFFSKKHIVSALAFLLLFRLPEAFCVKLLQPFLIASRADGGLQLSMSQIAVASGTTGVVALLAGGILGGIAISRRGLKFWLWPMAAALTLPCALYLILAIFQPQADGIGFIWINIAIFIEQFGYGFGFTAFMLYMVYFSEGERKTSYYAFCTAFMALGMMIPGMFAGNIFDVLKEVAIIDGVPAHGYVNFFMMVLLSSLVTFAVCAFVRIRSDFGKKTH